jgi:hypothetical protein
VVTLGRAGVLEGKEFAFTEEFLPTAAEDTGGTVSRAGQ